MINNILQKGEKVIDEISGKGDGFSGGTWSFIFKGTIYFTNMRILFVDRQGLLNRSYFIKDTISVGIKKAAFSKIMSFEFSGDRSFIFRVKTDVSKLNSIVQNFNELKSTVL